MLRPMIRDAIVRKWLIGWAVVHPTDGGVLAYADTEAEARAYKEAINDIVKQLRARGVEVPAGQEESVSTRGVTGPTDPLRDMPSTVDAAGEPLHFLDLVESTARPGHRATVGPIYSDGSFDVCDIDIGLFGSQRPSQWRKVKH